MRRSSEDLPMTAAYFLLILREHGKTAAAREALLEGSGVSEELLAAPRAEISLGQLLRLIANGNARLAPGWGLEMGALFHSSTHGPLGFATVSAPTLGKSLEMLARFAHVRAPFFRIRASLDGRFHRLAIEEIVESRGAVRQSLLEMVLLSAQELYESVLGRPMREAAFELPYEAPPYAARYGDYFHGEVRFSRLVSAVVIPAEWLATECPLADPIMFDTAVRSLETGDRRLDSRQFTVAHVEQILAAAPPGLGLDEAAKRLRVSRRTLVRRLGEAGTGYRELVEARLKRRTEELLRDSAIGLSEIAYALGYEDPANFGRACRRWFGMSPGSLRRKLLG